MEEIKPVNNTDLILGKYTLLVSAGTYTSDSLIGLMWELFKHRCWHLWKHKRWMD